MSTDAAVVYFLRLRSLVALGVFGQDLTAVEHFMAWFREPDFSSDYRQLFDLELKLNAGQNVRKDHELLSSWRLVRDPSYGVWAKEQGVRRCQLSLFGMRETTDWFYRRSGAFDDVIRATDRLLECGIAPRWQLFQTLKILPEIDAIVQLAEELKLVERCESIGIPFVMFIHDPTPVGEARAIEDLRLAADDLARMPKSLLDATKRHMGRSTLYMTEAEWISQIQSEDERPIATDMGAASWLNVDKEWNLYPNHVSMEPWWKIGNLLKENPESILHRYLTDGTPALRAQ